MSPVTFHFISVADEQAFLETLRSTSTSATHQIHYIGHCEHWIHSPKTSLDALTGPGDRMQRWNYLIIANALPSSSLTLPSSLPTPQITAHWSITAPIEDSQLANLTASNTTRTSATPPPLPAGWNASDFSSLTASEPPSDLEASLALSSTPLGSSKNDPPTPLKDFISTSVTSLPGPVSMFNLVACLPGQRERFFGYIAAFAASVGSRYGGEAQLLGAGVTDWSSREAEGLEAADPEAGGSGVWEDVALVWYPSLWHFAKLLDDVDYADADRKFKVGVLRDNPILCCREVVL
ncbi:hypothetical protein Q7P36_005108 [Cladosporium allicinum]